MRNVLAADLYLDIGGVEATTPVLHLTRGSKDPERQFVTVNLPAIEENVVVLARIQKSTLTPLLRGYKFLNVVDDEGIAEALETRLLPAERVLTGSAFQVDTRVPEAMVDFSPQSSVSLKDPEDAAAVVTAPVGQRLVTNVSASGNALSVQTLLKDKSGHEKAANHSVAKIPFFSDTPPADYLHALDADEVLIDLLAIAGLTPNESLVAGFNKRSGGYRLAVASRTLETAVKGQILHMYDAGTALIVQIQVDEALLIKRYPVQGGSVGAADKTWPVAADLIAAQGANLWFTYGNAVGVSRATPANLVPTLTLPLRDRIVAAQAVGANLYVLTEAGMYRLGVAVDAIPSVQQDSFVAVPNQNGFRLMGNKLYTWKGTDLSYFELQDDGSLLLLGTATLPALVDKSTSDGEVLWLRATTDEGSQWFALEGGSVIGIFPGYTRALVLTPAAAYFEVIRDGISHLEARNIAVAAQAFTLDVAVTDLPHAVQLRVNPSADPLGALTLHVETGAGQRVPAVVSQIKDGYLIQIGREQLASGDLIVVGRTHGGSVDQPVTVSTSTTIAPVTVNFATAPVQGALIPMTTTAGNGARISTQAINVSGQSLPMAVVTGTAYQWLQLPSSGTALPWSLAANGSEIGSGSFSLSANPAETGSVTLLAPANNVAVKSGDLLNVQYTALDSTGADFRFAEVSLFDFDQDLVNQVLVNAISGQVAISLPAVTQKDTYSLRVRAYWGDNFHFTEQVVSVKLFPQQQVPQPTLKGVTNAAFTGSWVNYQMTTSGIEKYLASIEIRDHDGKLLASGDKSVEMLVPEGLDGFEVTASLADKGGNIESRTYSVRVVAGVKLTEVATGKNFSLMLPDVDNVWHTQGRELRNKEGELLTRLDADITAITRIGDRLLVALKDQGLAIIDPAENFLTLSFYPITGNVSDLAMQGESLLVIINGQLQAFNVKGNWISPIALKQTVWGSSAKPAYSNVEEALDVQPFGSHFVLLREESAVFIENTSTSEMLAHVAAEVALQDPVAMVQSAERVFVSTESGQLVSFDSKARLLRHGTFAVADQLLAYAPYLVAINNNGIQLWDVTNPYSVGLVGDYKRSFSGNVKAAQIYGGKLWIGDTAGQVLGLQAQSGEVLTAHTGSRGHVTDVAIEHGQVLAAGNYYGALYYGYNAGSWTTKTYPEKGYSLSVGSVHLDAGIAYLALTDKRQVIALETLDLDQSAVPTPKVVFNNVAVSDLVTTSRLLIAVEGNRLHLANKYNLSQTDVLSLPAGENVVSLAAFGDTIYASTINRRIYRIQPGTLPLDIYADVVESIVDGATGADTINHLSLSGDYLFFAVGTSLHRMDLNNFADSVIELPGSLAVNAIHYADGVVWVAHRKETSSEVRAIDPSTWLAASDIQINLPQVATSLAAHHGYLAIGLGDGGVRIVDLNGKVLSANAALQSPEISTVYKQGDYLALSVQASTRVNSIQYFVNDQLVGGTADFPYRWKMQVPANLRNGQPFTLRARIETDKGDLVWSNPRKVLLQGEDLPGNLFRVRVVSPVSGALSYAPKAAELRAEVLNSSQPVSMVEYYEATAVSGPYKIIGKHYGPEFVIYRDYAPNTERFLKVRAIDMYGNVTESDPVKMVRVEDTNPPSIGAFKLSGAVINNKIIEKNAYSVSVSVNDAESGIESAILRRNGLIVAARFEEGTLVLNEKGASKGTSVVYQLDVKDKAGKSNSVTHTYEVIEDAPPAINRFTASSAQIIERGFVTVNLAVTDQIAIENAEILWNGFVTPVPIKKPATAIDLSGIVIRDRRTQRVTADSTQSLVLRVSDNQGQVSERSIPLTLVADRVPDASKLTINHQTNAFYGDLIQVSVLGFTAANDGSDPVLVSFVETNPASGKNIQIEHKLPTSELRHSLAIPSGDLADNQYRFRVQLTDQLGQSGQTVERVVSLTHKPNAMRFFNTSSDVGMNNAYLTVGDTASYQVEIVDKANRRVPSQQVRWKLQEIVTGTSAPVTILGTTSSNADGLAYINFDTGRKAGRYRLLAELVTNPSINISMGLRISAGETSELRISHIPDVEAGKNFHIQIRGYDAGGNFTEHDSVTKLRIALPYSGFHFGFATGVSTGVLETGGEIAEVRLEGGKADLDVSAHNTAGSYTAALTMPTSFTAINTKYDVAGDSNYAVVTGIALNVIAAEPFQLEMKEISRTNLLLGDSDRLEAGEVVTVAATLLDKHYNRVYRLQAGSSRITANASFTANVDGSAYINSIGQIQTINITEGYGTFKVTTPSVEAVHLTATGINPAMPSLAKYSPLTLDFLKLRPAIKGFVVQTAINSQINPIVIDYSEPLAASTGDAPASLSLAGAPAEGQYSVDNDKLRFAPAVPLVLGSCYALTTSDSSLRGLAANDEVLDQSFNVCAPDIYLQVPAKQYLLEGTALTLGYSLADGLTVGQLRNSMIQVAPVDTPATPVNFNWNAPVVTMPTITGSSFPDGQLVGIRLTTSRDPGIVTIGNELKVQVLTVDGDFDNDGLGNKLELDLDLNPINDDSDNDGTIDGDEDQDNDGLTNAEELALGGLLNDSDTDDDGLSDADEVRLHLTDLLKPDTDEDGVPDYVEVVSDSDPTLAAEANVDIELITAIELDRTEIAHRLGSNPATINFNVTATVVHNGRTYEDVKLANDSGVLEFTSSNLAVATVDLNGTYTPIAEGESDLTVTVLRFDINVRAVAKLQVLAPLESKASSVIYSASSNRVLLWSGDRLWAWGYNNYGLSGLTGRSSPPVVTPRTIGISALDGVKVIALHADDSASFAFDDRGHLWAWGSLQENCCFTGLFRVASADLSEASIVTAVAGYGRVLFLDSDKKLHWLDWRGSPTKHGLIDLSPLGGAEIVQLEMGRLDRYLLDDQNRWWIWDGIDKGISLIDLSALGTNSIRSLLGERAVDTAGNIWNRETVAAGAQLSKPATTVNNSLATAVNFDGLFGVRANPQVRNSATVPHASVRAETKGGKEYYKFTVLENGSRVDIDIDATNGFDSRINLLNSSGSVIAQNDDNGADPGSFSGLDSYLTLTLNAGTYFVEVMGSSGNMGLGNKYDLHVSLIASVSVIGHKATLNWSSEGIANIPSFKTLDRSNTASRAALDDAGKLWTWGSFDQSALNLPNSDKPVLSAFAGQDNVGLQSMALASNANFFALDKLGNFWSMGANSNGQLGNGRVGDPEPTPSLVGSINVGRPELVLNQNAVVGVRMGQATSVAFADLQITYGKYFDSQTLRFGSDAFSFANNQDILSIVGFGQTRAKIVIDPSVCSSVGDKFIKLEIFDKNNELLLSKNSAIRCIPDISTVLETRNESSILGVTNNSTTTVSVGFMSSGSSASTTEEVCSGCTISMPVNYCGTSSLVNWLGALNVYENGRLLDSISIACPPVRNLFDAGNERNLVNANGSLWSWGKTIETTSGTSWGSNSHKIPNPEVLPPIGVDILSIQRINSGPHRANVIDNDGQLWHGGKLITIGEGEGVNSIVSGDFHYLALDEKGRLWTWGRYSGYNRWGSGKKGLGVTPSLIEGIPNPIITMSAGSHSLALDNQNQLWGWGLNVGGSLGKSDYPGNRDNAKYQRTPEPIQIPGLGGAKILAVEAASGRNFVLDDQSRIWAWGENLGALAGVGSTHTHIPFLLDTSALAGVGIQAISSSSHPANSSETLGTLIVLDNNGQVWVSRPGNGSALTPLNQTGLGSESVIAIDAGFNHNLLLDTANRLWAWGNNDKYQLANTGGPSDVPVLVGSLAPLDQTISIAAKTELLKVTPDAQGQINAASINVVNPSFQTASLRIAGSSSLYFEGTKTELAVNWVGNKNVAIYLDSAVCVTPGTKTQTLQLYDNADNLVASADIHIQCQPDLAVSVNVSNGNAELVYQGGESDLLVRFQGAVGVNVAGDSAAEQLVCAGCKVTLPLDYECPRYALEPLGALEVFDVAMTQLTSEVVSCPRSDVKKLATVNQRASYMIRDAFLWSWGYGYFGSKDFFGRWQSESLKAPELTLTDMISPAKLKGLDGGSEFILALDTQSTVWAWGRNEYQALGQGILGAHSALPTPVDMTALHVLDDAHVVSVSAGHFHGVALDSKGRVWAWGDNGYGQLGLPLVPADKKPSLIDPLVFGGKKILSVQADSYSTMALDELGQLWVWGRTGFTHLDGSSSSSLPKRINLASVGIGKVIDFGFSESHILVLAESGQLWAWGDNYYGQIGNGTSGSTTNIPVIVDLSSLAGVGVRALSVGNYFNLLLDMNGKVWSWGRNNYGQLGTNTPSFVTRPSLINHLPLEGAKIKEVFASAEYSLAIDENNSLWSWGSGGDYRLGTGSNSNSYAPAPVKFPLPVEKIQPNTLAIRELLGVEGVMVPLEITDEGDHVIRVSSSDLAPKQPELPYWLTCLRVNT